MWQALHDVSSHFGSSQKIEDMNLHLKRHLSIVNTQMGREAELRVEQHLEEIIDQDSSKIKDQLTSHPLLGHGSMMRFELPGVAVSSLAAAAASAADELLLHGCCCCSEEEEDKVGIWFIVN